MPGHLEEPLSLVVSTAARELCGSAQLETAKENRNKDETWCLESEHSFPEDTFSHQGVLVVNISKTHRQHCALEVFSE